MKGRGERLFSAHEMQPHLAMPLIAKLLRNSIPLAPPPPAPEEEEEEEEEVSFQWKNPDFLLKNPEFLLRNPDSLLKNVDFITKPGVRRRPDRIGRR